jgi:hypothetical protein
MARTPGVLTSAPGGFSKKNLRGLIGEAKMSGPFERLIVGFCGICRTWKCL